MTELEILAELKIAYLALNDIFDNQDEQLTIGELGKINRTMNNLEKIYNNIYSKIKKENKKSLYFKDDSLIADEIYNDYIYKDQYITYADIENEEKWWKDNDFLTK